MGCTRSLNDKWIILAEHHLSFYEGLQQTEFRNPAGGLHGSGAVFPRKTAGEIDWLGKMTVPA